MLFLVLQLGTDRYLVESASVVEVLPLVNIRRIPGVLQGVAGLFDYHGTPVPLIDLKELVQGTPSRKWMSTRIILVGYRDKSDEVRLLGLLAEHATEVMRRSEKDFTDPGVAVREAPYLGPVITDAAGIIQQIRIQNLVSESAGDQLFMRAWSRSNASN